MYKAVKTFLAMTASLKQFCFSSSHEVIFSLLLEREEWRVRNTKGREKHQLVGCLQYVLRPDQTHNLGICLDRESNLQPFVMGGRSHQLSHAGLGSLRQFYVCI